jgi:ubiquitin-like 1-activating enzyme E1 B
MIDCGSSGKFAQSVPVIPFRSGCYECSPAVAPSGPKITCTIRSTPENFEHCAAWAFHLFNVVYGDGDSNDLLEIETGSSVFKSVFVNRIIEQREMTELWKERPPPSPIAATEIRSSGPLESQTETWSDDESAAVFQYLCDHIEKPQVFDKDRNDHLGFVTAAANLRAQAFHITRRCSMFEAKSLVAVVEPALATTNSAISSVAVLQMAQIIEGTLAAKAVWLSHDLKGPRLTPTSLEKQNPACNICGSGLWEVRCDFERTLVRAIGEAVGAKSPSISLGGLIVFDSDDEEAASRRVCQTRLRHGDIVCVTDLDGDDAIVNVILIAGDEFCASLVHAPVAVAVRQYNPDDWEDSGVEVVE